MTQRRLLVQVLTVLAFCSMLHAERFATPLSECSIVALAKADCDENSSTLIYETDPDTFVLGCISVESGALVLSDVDLESEGPHNLPLIRVYNSFGQQAVEFGAGFRSNYPTRIGAITNHGDHYHAMVEEFGGSELQFTAKKQKLSGKLQFTVEEKTIRNSLTNTGSGAIGGRSNLKNKCIRIDTSKDKGREPLVATTGTGSRLQFNPAKDGKLPIYLLDRELCSNGLQIHYQYASDKVWTRIQQLNQVGQVGRWLEYDENSPGLMCIYRSSSGQKVEYHFDPKLLKKTNRPHLARVEAPGKPAVRYDYEKVDKDGRYYRVNSVHKPDGRSLTVDYDQQGRIKTVYSPAGVGAELIPVYRLAYKSDKGKAQKTTVRDYYGNETRYHFDAQQRLKAIERFLGSDQLQRTERFYWGAIGSQDESLLVGRSVEDGAGIIRSCWRLEYDLFGNVIAEHLHGNLTGRGPQSLQVDAKGAPVSACEVFTKRYRYSQDGRNLLLWEHEDRGPEMHYSYMEGTDLLASKLLSYDGAIQKREFHGYDINGFLVEKIVDDGSGQERSDLSNVTLRHIERFVPETNPLQPGYGLPLVISEYCLEGGQERLLKETHRSYVVGGKPSSELVYDADGELASSQTYVYDDQGLLVSETDALGQSVVYAYDANHNCVRREEVGAGRYSVYEYDHSDRQVAETVVHEDGSRYRSSVAYDYLGNAVAEADELQRLTNHSYDGMGRKTATFLPAVQGVSGILRPVETLAYDHMDRVIRRTDARGNQISMTYNVRGDVTATYYPDGTVERNEYHTSGTLARTYHRNGCRTEYSYSAGKKLVAEQFFDSQGKLVTDIRSEYKADLLMRQSTARGAWVVYTYDGAGRKVEERTEADTLLSRVGYEYDAMGRLVKETFWQDGSLFFSNCTAYDALNRKTATWTETKDGSKSQLQELFYDRSGNVVERRVLGHEQGPAVYATMFNSKGQVLLETDPMGYQTQYSYDDSVCDATGQRVLQQYRTDALGRVTRVIQDSHGRIACVGIQDADGTQLALESFVYDEMGNKRKHCVDRMQDGRKLSTQITEWQYGPGGRLEHLVEAVGTPEQRYTRRYYSQSGELAEIVKPDGVRLLHQYDPAGRLARLSSSDGSVDYRYTYDSDGQIHSVEDATVGHKTSRYYDMLGRTIEERLANGLKLEQTLDLLGRTVQLTLPDESQVKYRFSGQDLSEVCRGSLAHQYHYDSQGRVTQIDHPWFSTNQTYDLMGRSEELYNPWYRQQMHGYDAVGNLLGYTTEKGHQSYVYDSLNQLSLESGTRNNHYCHDSVNNRTRKNGVINEVNALNQLVDDETAKFDYDTNGNLIAVYATGQSTLFRYDALDRLVELETAEGTWSYAYDAFNRRICKVHPDGMRELYLYWGQNEIGMYDQSGTPQQLRVLGQCGGPETGAALLIELCGKTYVPLHNYRGDVVGLVNESGISRAYEYSAFGESSSVADGNPWRFASKRRDPETGFYYFGHRYYMPETGRWITTDPKGYSEGPNLYNFALNRPTVLTDHYGLSPAGMLARHVAGRMTAGGRRWAGRVARSAYDGAASAAKVTQALFTPAAMEDSELLNSEYVRIHEDGHIVVGLGELAPDARLVFINGICNNYDDLIRSALLSSQANGYNNVHIIQDPTSGIIGDLFEAFKADCGGEYPTIQNGQSILRGLWNEMDVPPSQRKLKIEVHSKGGLTLYGIGKGMSSQMRAQTTAYLYGSARLIENGYFGKITHYYNMVDPVTVPYRFAVWKDPERYNVKMVDAGPRHWLDHSFANPAYQREVRANGVEWKKIYGWFK